MVAFLIFSITAFIGALTVITTSSPYRALLGLFVNFFSIGAIFLITQSPFVGFVQIVVYAGGVIILFLFVLMLISPKSVSDDFDGSFKGFLYILFAISLLGGIIIAVMKSMAYYGSTERFPVSTSMIAKMLFSKYLIPFEIVSILLLIAIVASFFIAKREV